MLHRTVQALAFAAGALVLLFGLGLAVGRVDVVSGAWLVLLGTGIMLAALLQRTRYRSLAGERLNLEPGPGGGEFATPEPRFRPTDEVFVDPGSGRRMRVFADPRTGERRYLAE